MQKTAIVTGILGQDGSYLAEYLLNKGYRVIGIRRRAANPNFENIEPIVESPGLEIIAGDITDSAYIFSCLAKYKPEEFYNLAAQSFVHSSFEQPLHTFDVDTKGVINILEGIRQVLPTCKLYQASTSEMFGTAMDAATPSLSKNGSGRIKFYQDENTAFIPQSPYAIAKVAAHHMCRLYRESYGLFVSCGILFNHESPRRGKEFVTRKITDYVAQAYLGKTTDKLRLGNLDASRDWGFAGDYVKAMHLMLQHTRPDDYVVCTGVTNTVEQLCQFAFNHVNLDYKQYVVIDEEFKRPAEVPYLLGRPYKITNELGWKPSVTFEELIKVMVSSDVGRYSCK